MAISMGTHAMIYRGDDLNLSARPAPSTITEITATAAQKIEFNNVLVGVDTWSHSLERFRPNVPDPNAEAPLKPDTGLNTFKVMLHCSAHVLDVDYLPGTAPMDHSATRPLPTDGNAHPLDRLRRWYAQPSTAVGYDEGRFGLWFWQDPILNHRPQLNAGYKLSNVQTHGTLQEPSRFLFDIELEYSGAIRLHDGLGSA